MEKLFNKRNAVIVVCAAVIFKIFVSAVLELHPDEAYYWLWSQHLSLGYYDHSPMIAYFIKLTTLFSDAEVFVRLSSVLVTIILSVLMWKFAKKLFSETVAAASVIAVNTLPLMLIGSIIITPDTPVFLFYSFTLYFLWRLSETGQTKYWYITGVFFGLTLLSKYTGILFMPCLLIYMILDKKLGWFKNKHFYLMFVTAFIVFLPVVIWNLNNGLISFLYQLNHGLYSTKLKFNFIFEYLGGQCLVAGPFIFIAGLIASIAYFKSKDSRKIFLASFSIPVILFFVFTALKRNPGANWPSFAYFAFSIMAVEFLIDGATKFKKNILIIGVAFNTAASVLVGLHAAYGVVPIYKFSEKAAVADATNWFSGWGILGNELLKKDVKYAVTHSHQWGGAIAYYTKGKIPVFLYNDRRNQFGYWPIADDLETSKTAMVFIDNRMEDDFTAIEGVEVIQVYRNGLPVRQYAIKEVDGYKIPAR